MMATTPDFKIRTSNHQFANLTKESEGEWRGPFCFVQGADTQFGMIESYINKSPVPRWEQEIALTKKAIAAINKMQPRPKFFVVCGDLLDAWPAEAPEIRALQELDFKSVFSELDASIPLVCVCGNHDVGNTPTHDTVAKYRSSFGDDYFSFWVGGVFFLVINSQYYFDPTEVVSEAEAQDRWLEEQLTRVGEAKHGVVFQHIPWFNKHVDEPTHDYFNLDIAIRHRMLNKFKQAGIKKVFCGHYHRNAGGFDGDLEVVVTSALGAQLGKDTHGVRLVGVTEDKIHHQYFGLDDLPLNVKIGELGSSTTSSSSSGTGGSRNKSPSSPPPDDGSNRA